MGKTAVMEWIKQYKIWIIAGVAVLALAIWLGIAVTTGTDVELKALSVDSTGHIAPDTAFQLTVKAGQDMDALRETIVSQPDIAYDLTETDPGSYLLTPLKFLDAGSELVFSIGEKSFAFTVQNRLLVQSAFPVDGSRNVPVDSGIEFVFNTQNLTQESFTASFSIAPKVEGYFSVGDGRYVFYPEWTLAYDTQYTVTLSPDMASEDGALLAEELRITFTTISEMEENMRQMFQLSGGGSVNSLTGEAPLIQAYIDQSVASPEQTVNVTLHAFEGWEGYLAAMEEHIARTSENYWSSTFIAEIDVTGLEEYASFDVTPIQSQSASEYNTGSWVIQFPDTLPEGWYVATITLEINGSPVSRTVFLQVSDLSVFYMAQDEDLLAWINDASTGEPVNGAEVEISGAYLAKGITGEDGVVHITDGRPPEYEAREVSTYLTVKSGDRTFVDTDIYRTYYGDGGNASGQYMSYLFTDRPLYHTTDTIQVWGMIRPRVAGTPLPEDLRLVLGDDIVSEAVMPLPNGTFTATLEVENLFGNTWPGLYLMAGEEEYFWLSLRFEDFVKPIYTAVTAPERPVYLLNGDNDEFRVGVDVSTFDGTPVSDFGIRIGSWTSSLDSAENELRTDARGHADAVIRVIEDEDTWYPQSYNYEFYSDEAQDEGFYLYGTTYGIHRDVMLRAIPDLQSGGSRVEVTTHRIDISRVQTPEQVWEKDILKGEALSVPVKATVKKMYYEKIKTGTHYDFVNRVSVESFRYEQREELVDTVEFSTANGSYTLEGLPVTDDEACYYVVLEATDSRGRTVRTTAYLGELYSRYGAHNTGTHNYTLVKQTNPEFSTVIEGIDTVRIESWNTEFEDGENASFLLLDNDLPMEGVQGRILYSVVQDQFSHVGVTDQEQFTLPFSEALLPNYVITGAYFDGKHIFALENTYISFNPGRRELEIRLEPEQDTYRPADQLKVEASVTNAFTGEPAAGTEVVISVVDEAVFAIQEQYPNILRKMYEEVYYPYIRKYTSYLQLDFGGPGEKGGGGGDNMRTEFEDTAYFAVATTDSQGKASFECQLPDNITSWRLTSLALSPENHAGNTKSNVVATKEFFILPIVNDTLLEGDSFSVGVYGTGAQVTDSDQVQYRITVEGDGVNETQEVFTTLREYAAAQFGNLKTGDYTVTFEAECKDYQDGVRLPFSVVQSGVEVSLVKTVDLRDGVQVDSLRYPVNISFYGRDMKDYNTVFQSVYGISTGGRADMRLARRYVAQQFQKQGADWYNASVLDADDSDLGGAYVLSLFPYSEQDLELTVKARLALPEMVLVGSLRNLDATNIGEYGGARSAVYLANALAGEPLTANVQNMLEGDNNLDYVDRIYLALALALSGDTEGAQGWYNQLVKPNLSELTGIGGDVALYVNVEDAARSQGDCTAAASLLATALSTDESGGLARYLAEKKSAYEPYIFEQIYYLQKNEPSATSPASFTYVRDGKTQTVELGSGFTSLSFTRSQLEEANFAVGSGEVYADVYYAGAPDQTADDSKKMIGFTKKVEPAGDGFKVGELVKITLTPDFSALDTDIGDTMLVVDDYIPTGMRFERYDHDYSRYDGIRGWHLNSRQGQRLQYTVYGVGYTRIKPIVYYVRCTTLGDYVVESAYITSASGETWGATGRDTVSIW